MGMGEPFLNYQQVVNAANLLNHKEGINLSAKRITISTVGIIPKIKQYTKEGHKYKLAISLNSSSQDQRLKIMPISKTHSIGCFNSICLGLLLYIQKIGYTGICIVGRCK